MSDADAFRTFPSPWTPQNPARGSPFAAARPGRRDVEAAGALLAEHELPAARAQGLHDPGARLHGRVDGGEEERLDEAAVRCQRAREEAPARGVRLELKYGSLRDPFFDK